MIEAMHSDDTGITVDLGCRSLRLGWTWLRDHARNPASFMASTQQRLVTAAEVAAAGRPTEVSIAPGRDAIDLTWADGTAARFEAEFLRQVEDPTAATDVALPQSAWTGREMAERHAPIAYDDIITDGGTRLAVERLWRDGVIVVCDVPAHIDDTRRVLERFGYVRTTIFGGMWEYGNDGGYDDTASTTLEITPHTDGTYSHDAPGLLALHCHAYDATGGENTFVDGITLTERLSDASRSILSTTDVPAQYIGDGAHLMSARPPLRLRGDRLVQVSYNHHDRAPFVLPEPEMSRLYAALHEFDALANDPALQFEVALRPGDMVMFDNWRLLHGRRAFDGHRRIAGGYLNREDVESTTRLLLGP